MAFAAVTGCGQHNESDSLGKQSQALSTGVVISAVYGGGGGAGAVFTHDYVELFNRGTTQASINGWALQYSRTDKGPWTSVPLPNVTIDPGKYYLIQLYTSGAVGAALPTPDFADMTGPDSGPKTNYGTTNGMVALTNDTTLITCGFEADAAIADAGPTCASSNIVDLVGYGNTTFTSGSTVLPPAHIYEGSGPAVSGAATKAVMRKGGGCVETDDNPSDFEAVTIVASGGPGPRNSASPVNDCTAADAGSDAETSVQDTAVAADATDAADSTADTSPDAPADAADSGTAPEDTGSAPEDTGSAPEDTGSVTVTDTGTPVIDTGTETLDELKDDGCGCRVAGGGSQASLAGGLAAALFALGTVIRRRRS